MSTLRHLLVQIKNNKTIDRDMTILMPGEAFVGCSLLLVESRTVQKPVFCHLPFYLGTPTIICKSLELGRWACGSLERPSNWERPSLVTETWITSAYKYITSESSKYTNPFCCSDVLRTLPRLMEEIFQKN